MGLEQPLSTSIGRRAELSRPTGPDADLSLIPASPSGDSVVAEAEPPATPSRTRRTP
jgi:hypothetical protein